jgi:hypothetical protein
MGTAPGESKLFHAIVVVGLSFASGACGAAEGSDGRSAPGDSGADATEGNAGGSIPDANPNEGDSATEGTIELEGGGAEFDTGFEPVCGPDAEPATNHCIWPIFL